MKAEPDYYKDAANEWRWRIVASNGQIVADSSEGYRNLLDCRDGYLAAQTADD